MPTVLVSEADNPIGASLAIGLAAAGHRVVAASRSGARPTGADGRLPIAPVRLDLAEPRSIRPAVEEAFKVFQSLDIVIANGSVGRFSPLELSSDSDIDDTLAINLSGQLRLLQAVIPHLRASRQGRIVGISSIVAMIGLPGGAVSCAARSGFEAALDALRHELRPFDIKISIVQAGPATSDEYGIPRGYDSGVERLYQPLAQAVSEFGCHVEEPTDVLDAVERALADANPQFRYSLGPYGVLAERLRRSDDDEIVSSITELFATEA